MRKTIGIIVLFGYMAFLAVLATAEYYYQTGKAQKDAGKLKIACILNPFFSDYQYELFNYTKDLESIKTAIALEPLKPLYHMSYGLELVEDYRKRTRVSDQTAFREIKRAYELKPWSKNYKKIYEEDSKPFLK